MKTYGLIIRKIDQGESDMVFTLYTKDFGKIKLVAKSVRKITSKLRFNLELFCLGYFEFVQGRNQKIITDVLPKHNFGKMLEKSPRKIQAGFYLARLLDKFLRENESDGKIWSLVLLCLKRFEKLGETVDDYSKLLRFFELKFVKFLGYMPDLHLCVSCGKKIREERNFLSLADGRLLCPVCFQKLTLKDKACGVIGLNPKTIKILRLFFEKDFDFVRRLKLERGVLDDLKKISKEILEYFLEGEMAFHE